MAEFPIEIDTAYGVRTAEASAALNPAWQEAAAKNVNDDSAQRPARLKELRARLAEEEMELRPGDDAQLLGVLRAANCDVKEAVEVARAFLSYQQYCGNGNIIQINVKFLIKN